MAKWMEEEDAKAENQIATGTAIANQHAHKRKTVIKEKSKPTSRPQQTSLFPRRQKNFRPTLDRLEKWYFLEGCSKMTGKKSPELIDEALDLLFQQYPEVLKLYKEFNEQKTA